MMNQGGSADTIARMDPNLLEKRQIVDPSEGQASTSAYSTLGHPLPPSATASKAGSWTMHWADNNYSENGLLSTSSCHQQTEPLSRDVQDGLNAASHASTSSSLRAANGQQEYAVYSSNPSSTDPYGYGNTGYPQGYYCSYPQQTSHSYSQQGGVYQNSGAPYQPLTSFQNTGSYAGPTSYPSTYYNTGDYQTTGGYTGNNYSNQTNLWNEGQYANYPSHQYSNYASDSNGAHSSSTVAATPLHYQQDYKQWADYYSHTNVSCAPGTENVSVTSVSSLDCPIPGATGGYPISNSQPPPPGTTSWRPELSSSELPSLQAGAVTGAAQDGYWKHGTPGFQNHLVNPMSSYFQKPLDSNPLPYESCQDQQKIAFSQGPNLQNPATNQVPQNYQSPLQTFPSLDTQRVSTLQIPTNPRIASSLALSLPKTDKDSSTTNATTKPSYISVSMPKTNNKVPSHDAADSMLKPEMFPTSLRAYVERALSRCKDDSQKATCQNIMKEMITKASADGTLFTRDWDTEPLFPLPNMDAVNKDSEQSSVVVSSLTKYKRSPSRRTRSRWEPISEEKLVEKLASVNHVSVKDANWDYLKEKDGTFSSGKSDRKVDSWSNSRLPPSQQQTPGKNSQRPVKKQRFGDNVSTAENSGTSSDSDKEQGLTAYYSSAITLANSPEERRRRENRSKRFEKGHGHRTEFRQSKPKAVGSGNLYTRRASTVDLCKNYDDGGSRAVEDIDWDALTVKGTCQEIEKNYLRLTSAPDPTTVRPEEVLEKALLMVQSSPKNYFYKCDQLKSIRQDLTVQRIRNELTVKVYETHARLALETGDLPEYNQCQSQLKSLYAEGIEGCHMEFSAYSLLCVLLHSHNNRDLLSSMARLSDEVKNDEAVRHALAVRAAITSGNYVMFFRLYKMAPNLNSCLMDFYVEKIRFEAVRCMSRSYRPTLPVAFIAQVLGFTSVLPTTEGSDGKDMDGLEECEEWLRAHGASLTTDNSGEMLLDTKASSSTLYMPEPEDAVAHGDASLAVNDFLTRTS